MTNELAIRILTGDVLGTTEQTQEAVIMAVKALSLPEIIRCKDCKFIGTDATCCHVCNREGMGLRPYHVYHDDFCSYAEKADMRGERDESDN